MSRYRESPSPPANRRGYGYGYDTYVDPERLYNAYGPRRRDSGPTQPSYVEKVEKLNNRTRFITQTRPQAHVSAFQPSDPYVSRPRRPSPPRWYGIEREEVVYGRRAPLDSEGDSSSEAGSEASFVLDIPRNPDFSTGESDDPLCSVSSEKLLQRKPEKSQGSYNETVHRVLRSQWLGDARANDIVAELTTEHVQASSMRADSPLLMKWIHLESQCPSFDYFVEYVQNCPGLDEYLKQDAVALLEQSRNHELPIYTSDGTKGRYFESFLDQELVNKPNNKKEKRNIQLLCLPYFSLAPYSGYTLPKLSVLHPIRTLLQYSSASTSKKRDMEQAVCKLDHTAKGQCFHIPQIWCLILDSELLLTCSHLSAPEVQRDLIKVEILPTSQVNTKAAFIRVSEAGGRVWMLPAKDCKSWFQFTSWFWPPTRDQEFEHRYAVFHESSVVDSTGWARLVSEGPQILDIKIRLKKTQIFPRPSRIIHTHDTQSETEIKSQQESNQQSNPRPSTASLIFIQDMSFRTKESTVNTATEGSRNVNATSQHSKSLFNNLADAAVEINEVRVPFNKFHYFLWINAVVKQPNNEQGSKKHEKFPIFDTFSVRMDGLANMFKSMQSFLDKSNSVKRVAFKKCPSRRFNEVEALLQESRRRSNQSRGRGQDRSRSRPPRNLTNSGSRSRSRGSRSRQRSRSRSRPRVPGEQRVVPYAGHSRRDYTEPENIGRGHAERIYVGRSYDQPPSHQPSPRSISNMKQAFFKRMQNSFTFFFPLNFTSNLIKRYWGAVYDLISKNDTDFWGFYQTFQKYHNRTMDNNLELMDKLVRVLSDGKGPLPWEISLPKEFGNAWLHLVTFLVLCASDSLKVNEQNIRQELSRCQDLLRKGSRLLVQSIGSQLLSEKEAVQPSGLVSVVIKKLLQDVTGGQPDISSTYYEYLRNLEQEIHVNPYNRSHQEKITYLRQEIGTILKVLDEQHQCVTALCTSAPREILDIKDHMREFYILQDCILAIKAKIQSFQEIEIIATELGIYNIRRIESNKDRQEAAILVFTIVTIIFLPLSFVSSYMGMNTADLRDMGSSQWIFWAFAIPITIIVVGLCLLFANKIEPTREWFGRIKNRLSSGKVQPIFIEKQTAEDLYLAAGPYSKIAGLAEEAETARMRAVREREREPRTTPYAEYGSVPVRRRSSYDARPRHFSPPRGTRYR